MTVKLKSYFLGQEDLQIIVDSLQSIISDFDEFYKDSATKEEKSYFIRVKELYNELKSELNYY